MFNLSVFFLFGLLVAKRWPEFTWLHALYALFSLTLVRMLPVAIALLGSGLQRSTVLFMGWFGPRGLASIVLSLVYMEQHEYLETNATVIYSVMVTVMLSIYAHGLSARPGSKYYAAEISHLPETIPESAK